MNLLLVEPGELAGDRVTIGGRRADHLRDVLGVSMGSRVRIGVIGGGIGSAEVLADDGSAIALRVAITDACAPPLPVQLVLAVPRPKVLTRALETIASFGVERVVLTNAWRVDKSYLDSPRLAPDAIATAIRLGAEQGATTHLPAVTLHRRLMELLDGDLARPDPAATRLVAHPGGVPIERAFRDRPVTLAIGPEGGWIQREVDTFIARGFTAVSLGTPILRVESAVAALLGQIVLLRRLTER